MALWRYSDAVLAEASILRLVASPVTLGVGP
jgi:hypothetical protein